MIQYYPLRRTRIPKNPIQLCSKVLRGIDISPYSFPKKLKKSIVLIVSKDEKKMNESREMFTNLTKTF